MLILAALFTVLERKVSWFRNKGLSNGNLWQSLLTNIAAVCVGYVIYLYFLN